MHENALTAGVLPWTPLRGGTQHSPDPPLDQCGTEKVEEPPPPPLEKSGYGPNSNTITTTAQYHTIW